MSTLRTSWFVVIMVALVAAGCGDAAENGSEGEDPTSDSEATAPDGAAGADGPIRIGGMLALSGNQAPFNVPIVNALRLAEQHINDNGGVLGRDVEVITEDSRGEPQAGIGAFNTLASQDVAAVIGVSTPVIAATLPVAEESGTVLLDISTVGPAIWRETDRTYSFSIYPKADVEMASQAEYAYEEEGARTAAVVAVNTETGQASADSFASAFEEAGGTVTGVERFEDGATDFRELLTRVANQEPDIVSIIHNVEGGTIVRQAGELELDLDFIGYSGSVNQQFLDQAGEFADGMLATSVGWNPESDNEAVQQFLDDYQAEFGEEPSVYAAMGYDGMHILAQAIEDAGSTEADAVAQALTGIEYEQGATGPTVIGEDGLALKTIYINRVEAGEWNVVDEVTPE